MKSDPFSLQRQTKSRNRRKLLTTLKDRPSTFSELLGSTALSRPVLSQYLMELVEDRMIERRVRGRKKVYELTQRGKAAELMRTRTLATGFRAATALIRDSQTADLFAAMTRMAKNNPEMFQTLVDWMLDLTLFLNSDRVFESRWMRILAGNQEEWRPFKEEIMKRTSTTSIQVRTPEEFRAMLDDVSGIFKEVLLADKARKS